MNVQRFNDVPIDMDRLTPEETASLEGYVNARARRFLGEAATLRAYLHPDEPTPDNVIPLALREKTPDQVA